MLKIVNLEKHTLPEGVNFSKLTFPHEWIDYSYTTQEQIIERAKDADIILTNKLNITSDIVERLPKLKFIAEMATGVNNLDLEACKKRNIKVSNLQHYSSNSVAEHALMLMLTLAKNLMHYNEKVMDKTWSKGNNFCIADFPIYELANKQLTIIGKGAIGQRLSEIAKAFNMKVVFAGRKNKESSTPSDKVPFTEAIRQADFISLHCPFNNETKDLIGADEFNIMKPNCILVNLARGGVVNEEALVEALISKKIVGAGTDVVSKEPMPMDNPLFRILGKSNFIITPHNAWAGDGALENLAAQTIENIESFVKDGDPTRRVA